MLNLSRAAFAAAVIALCWRFAHLWVLLLGGSALAGVVMSARFVPASRWEIESGVAAPTGKEPVDVQKATAWLSLWTVGVALAAYGVGVLEPCLAEIVLAPRGACVSASLLDLLLSVAASPMLGSASCCTVTAWVILIFMPKARPDGNAPFRQEAL